jgi:N-acetylated-alpha-linked acidic dipeptidase
VWLEGQNRFRDVPSVDFLGAPTENPPRSEPLVYSDPIGDDQTVFYLHLALPVSDMYYGADYGMYHSIYENPHWMKTIVDPDFGYHELMASMLGTAALRMAQADLLPFGLADAASDWRTEIVELAEVIAVADAGEFSGLESLQALAEEWKEAAAELEVARADLLASDAASAIPKQRWLEWNRQLMQVERSFYAEEGLPGAPWSRNLFSAQRFESNKSTLPGLRWSLEDGDAKQLERQKSAYASALQRARDLTRALANDLRTAAGSGGGGGVVESSN